MTGFKKATIAKILNNKISSWIASVKDEELRKLLERDTIVTGGAIASLLQGETPNDYDIYFRTFETTLAVSHYYVDLFNTTEGALKSAVKNYNPEVLVEDRKNCKGISERRVLISIPSAGIASETSNEATYSYFENKEEEAATEFVDALTKSLDPAVKVVEEISKIPRGEYRPVFFSDNAISLSNKIQLVIRFYGNAEEIHKNYDYVHTTNYYMQCDRSVTLNPAALESILAKNLVYQGSLYPIASIFRLRKFLARGWRISAGQQLKILWQISELDLNNMEVLMDQLIGVDTAYMRQLIAALKNSHVRPDATYVAKIIDEIF